MSRASDERDGAGAAGGGSGSAPPPSALGTTDPEIFRAIRGEVDRQRNVLELIASENFTSPAVLEATGSVLTNKYAEGLPGKRYYGGCEHVDTVERLARDRAVRLFGADHANVQPHSGAQANMASYFAFLEPGDRILGMDLSHGGHLTHGSPVNFSGKLYDVSHYGVRRSDERVDVDALAELAGEVSPRLIVAGWSAYPRVLPFEEFAQVARDVDCPLLVDMAHFAGLVAGGVHPSPVPHADVVTTTTHKTLRGPRAGMILCREQHAQAIDKAVFPQTQGGPLMHVIAAKAVCLREAATDEFRGYARRVVENAKALGETLASHGYKLVTGGTDTHLLLVDLRANTELTGKDAEEALETADITVNKNTVPFEERSPFVTSGIRIGTPALTTRGMGVDEMKHIGDLIHAVLEDPEDPDVRDRVRGEVADLCGAFPLYPPGGSGAGDAPSVSDGGFASQAAALAPGGGE